MTYEYDVELDSGIVIIISEPCSLCRHHTLAGGYDFECSVCCHFYPDEFEAIDGDVDGSDNDCNNRIE